MTGFQSDSVDVVIEQAANFPLTLILFYDQDIYCNSIMRSLGNKLLDVFIFKFEKNLLISDFKNFSPQNVNYFQFDQEEAKREFDFTDNPGTTFEAALPLILEDALTEYVKLFYVNLNTQNLQIPWIYII